jgi:hypothetical protein
MVDILPQTPEAMSDVAAATRRMRVMQYGEPMVQRMEVAGRTFGAAPRAAAVGPVSAPAEAPGIIARTAGKLPGLGARIARGGLALAPVAGALGAATDTQADVKEVADTTGLDYNSFGGRIGANVVNFLKQTGNAATLGGAGALGRGVANVMGGESFFEPYKAPAATVPGAPVQAAVPESVLTPTTPSAPLNTPEALPPVAPFTREDILGSRVPVSGTGAALNTRTGAVMNFDTRVPGAGAVSTTAPVMPMGAGGRRLPDIGGFYAGAAHLRNIAQDNANRLAAEKIRLEFGGKAATAAKDYATAGNETVRTQAAIQHLADNPGDYAGAAAIASGRSQGMGAFTFMPSMTGNDVISGNRRTGAATIQTPSRYATEQHVSADMANRKMTRAQVISAYEKQGIDTSRLKK